MSDLNQSIQRHSIEGEITPPIFCDIGITERCFFRCKMCRFWENEPAEEELSIEEWMRVVDSLEEFGSDNIRIHIVGGEPLLKEGIFDLVHYAHKKRFATAMVTNGFLIDKSVAREIVASGLDVISLSLESLNESTHDSLRGKEGAYQHLMRALDYLIAVKARGISLLTVIMEKNKDDLIPLAQWMQDNKYLGAIYYQAVSQPIATVRDAQWYEKEQWSDLWPHDKDDMAKIIDTLIKYKEAGYKIANSREQLEMFKNYFQNPQTYGEKIRCRQGNYSIYLRPTGEAFLCPSQGSSLGNVRSAKLKDLWYSKEAQLQREKIYHCRHICLIGINCFIDKTLL